MNALSSPLGVKVRESLPVQYNYTMLHLRQILPQHRRAARIQRPIIRALKQILDNKPTGRIKKLRIKRPLRISRHNLVQAHGKRVEARLVARWRPQSPERCRRLCRCIRIYMSRGS